MWAEMRKRCLNSGSQRYKDYGGRGIKICTEWNNPKVFVEHFMDEWLEMKRKYPNQRLSLDRINVNGNYVPCNCQIATMKMQANNTRLNRLITYRGKMQTMAQWAEELGLSKSTISYRINKLGWSPDKALTVKPENRETRMFTAKGITLSILGWSKRSGISRDIICNRIDRHSWSMSKVLNECKI